MRLELFIGLPSIIFGGNRIIGILPVLHFLKIHIGHSN